MIEIGKKQALTVINTTDFGIYLGEINKQEKVLLPIKQVPAAPPSTGSARQS